MRLYNGCPDKELQAVIDERVRLQKELEAASKKLKYANGGARCVYFPVEEKWSVWLDSKQITRGFYCKAEALRAGIEALSGSVPE